MGNTEMKRIRSQILHHQARTYCLIMPSGDSNKSIHAPSTVSLQIVAKARILPGNPFHNTFVTNHQSYLAGVDQLRGSMHAETRVQSLWGV
jgi:hypothetical protein